MGRSVLIVDDQQDWLEVLQDILAPMDIDVATARDRAKAEQQLDAKQFGLVILDIRLDETADLETERVQTAKMLAYLEQHHKETKYIVLTAYATLPFALQVFREFKPFDFFVKDEFSEQMSKFQATVLRALESEGPIEPTTQDSRLRSGADWLRNFELEKRKQEIITQLIDCLNKAEDQLVTRLSKRIEAKGGRADDSDAVWISERRKVLENRYREASTRVHTIERVEDIGLVQLWLTKECNQWLDLAVGLSS